MTPDTVIYGLGIYSILSAVYLVANLIFKKVIWDYPVVASMYIFLAISLLIAGIMLIEHIKITGTIFIVIVVVVIIWSFITYRLPAKKEDSREG
jgi:hypothetical protein